MFVSSKSQANALYKLTSQNYCGLSQAMRVTQEQQGTLKLEAYAHLLWELLMVQLQQCTAASVMSSQGWQAHQPAQVHFQALLQSLTAIC